MKALLFILALLAAAAPAGAHSGKARFHVVVDTDGAPDDLRALCMLLGNREAEVLAVTTSEGALRPEQSAQRVAELLESFHHEGIPVGVERAAGAAAPPWRSRAEGVVWGCERRPTAIRQIGVRIEPARALLARTLREEEEPVICLALGALTNFRDVLQAQPELAARIERIVWYDAPGGGANRAADPEAAAWIAASGVPLETVAARPGCEAAVTAELLEAVDAVATPYARRIAATHRAEPLAAAVAEGHLKLWDDLAVLALYAPELFASTTEGGGRLLQPAASADEARIGEAVVAVLRGKPDTESRVFYGFPTDTALYAADVRPLLAETLRRHGASEWRAGVLCNELHGHLGIYATVGVKMGIRAREFFAIGVDDIRAVSLAGSRPPVSCMNDGLQTATGATLGHGLIDVAAVDRPRPEACFTFKGKTLRLRLKPRYADRIRRDVEQGVALYGDLTEPYWQYVRALALRYWRDFDRHEIFDESVETDDSGGSVAENLTPAARR